jgi:hypothetical protein
LRQLFALLLRKPTTPIYTISSRAQEMAALEELEAADVNVLVV